MRNFLLGNMSLVDLRRKILPPTYKASAKIYITEPTLPTSKVPYVTDITGRSFLENQILIAESRVIIEKAIKNLNLDATL